MHRIIYSKKCHSINRFLALWMVLTLGITFFDASVQLFVQSVENARIIEENITTLAIEQITYEIGEVNGEKQIVPVIYGNEVMEKAKQSAAVIDINETNTVCARGKGLMPVYPSLSANSQGALNQLNTENVAAFHVRNNSGAVVYDDTGGMITYTLEMQVVQPLMIHPDAQVPEYIDVRGFCSHIDEPVPFEKGEEYVVIGHYFGVEMFCAVNKLGKYVYYVLDELNNPILTIGIYGEKGIPVGAVQQFRDCAAIMAADDPCVANLVAIARQNCEMFLVTGIDQIEGVPLFAMNDAYITQGRSYTQEEAKKGERLCIVSTGFAEENNLQVGDSIALSLYDHSNRSITMNGGKLYQINDTDSVLDPLQQDTFTIIGIYRTKEWGLNKFCFPPATVFVPLNSLIFQGTKGIDYADALILQNGSNKQFLQDVDDAGIRKGVYTIYDGGYMQFMASLKAMQKDTAVVMAVCFLLFLVVTFASLSLMVQHLKKDADIMLKIGADRKYTTRYMLLCVLPVILLATVSAYSIGCVIHVPLMALIEKWYAMSRPIYSNMVADAQGMLTGNMEALPLPIGTGTAGLLSCLMTCLLVFSGREGRKG